MTDLLQDLAAWMEALPPLWAYVAILLIAFGENIIPPIPGDMAIVFGGYLAGVGTLNFFAVVFLSTFGGALGFMAMYALGYVIGDALKDPDRFRWVSSARIEQAERWLERWGFGLVAANRFLSGLRSVISISVGIARVNAAYTAAFATLSALVWTTLIVYGGYAVGENWPQIVVYLRHYGRAVMTVALLALLVYLFRSYLKTRGSDSDRRESGNFNEDGG